MFCISKLPSVCSWEEATLDASYSVWPQASVRVNNPVFKPSQITPSATEDCRVWLETLGANISEVTVSVRHSGTWSCCGRPSLYREQALDPAQIELFTWLVRLCCGITWKCTDTQREFRAQTLRERCFCDYTPSTLTYKCSHSRNPPFYSSRAPKWTWMGVFTLLVTLPSCISKMYMDTERVSGTENYREASVEILIWWRTKAAIADIRNSPCCRHKANPCTWWFHKNITPNIGDCFGGLCCTKFPLADVGEVKMCSNECLVVI